MKIKGLLLFIILIQVACQPWKNKLGKDFSNSLIIKQVKNSVHESEQEMIKLELEDIFAQVLNTQKIDLSLSDTLYIIRGVNITNGFIYGRVWNNRIRIHYLDRRETKNRKFALNPKISITENSTKDFDTLIESIENNDEEFIVKKANKNQVLSGIPSWQIMSFKKNEQGKYEKTYFTIVDFTIHEDLKLD